MKGGGGRVRKRGKKRVKADLGARGIFAGIRKTELVPNINRAKNRIGEARKLR